MWDDNCLAAVLHLTANFIAGKEGVITEMAQRITIQTRHALEMGLLAK